MSHPPKQPPAPHSNHQNNVILPCQDILEDFRGVIFSSLYVYSCLHPGTPSRPGHWSKSRFFVLLPLCNSENSRFHPMCLISCLHPHRKTPHFKQQVFLPTAGSDTQEHLCIHTSCLLYAIWARWIQSGKKAEIRPCLRASVSNRSLKYRPSSRVYNSAAGLTRHSAGAERSGWQWVISGVEKLPAPLPRHLFWAVQFS